MAELSIRNYRRVTTVDLPLGRGVTLVCGRNGQGKSSTAEAARAALTADPLPARGDAEQKARTKKAAKDLVHDGAESGSVTLAGGNGSVQIRWPACEVKASGRPLSASAMAVGLRDTSLVAMDAKERFATLREVLKAEVTWNDLWAWLRQTRDGVAPPAVGEDLARKIWETVEKDGWVNAVERARTRGIDFQNQYKIVTGGKWGSVKGADWRPEAWDARWDNQPLAVFADKVTAARAALDAAIGTAAVVQDRRARLEQAVAAGVAAQEQALHVGAALDQAQKELAAHQKDRDSFVDPEVLHRASCPHCAKEVAVVPERGHGGGTLVYILTVPGPKLSDKDLEAARLKAASLDGAGQRIKDNLAQLLRQQAEAAAAVKAGEEAQAELAQMGPAVEGAAPEVVTAAQAALTQAEAAHAMVKAVQDAHAIHVMALQNLHIQAALGDAGVRAAVLAASIDDFNADLDTLAVTLGLPPVRIDAADASLTVGGRPFRDLSDSEGRVRVRALLQLAIAKRDGSDAVVIDIEAATDRRHILGLIKMCNQAEMPALITCHMDHPDDAPDLASDKAKGAGYVGQSFWVEDGQVAALPVGG